MAGSNYGDNPSAHGGLGLNHPALQVHQAPSVLVIFGGAGDLSHKKLLPALYNLALENGLPERFAIVGFSIEPLNDDSYREFARDGIAHFSRHPLTDEGWKRFAPMLYFVRGKFDEPSDYEKLKQRLLALEQERGTGGNRCFYFAIPPQFIDTCSAHISAAGLMTPPAGGPFTRVVVEKPIGHDLASAREINDQLAQHFAESQIFRIDHYLGKETVENLMVLRFANAIFEPIWTSHFIDHVQIVVAEQEGVGSRAGYYERAGALRDMVQSHMLQVLCMIAMEPPRTTSAEAVRDSKLEVIRSLRPFDVVDVEESVVRGQYDEGLVNGEKVRGYLAEENVSPNSTTETYVALRCFVENWRWAGVPFYLRTGKRLPKRASEITIHFKTVPRILYNVHPGPPLAPNVLSIRIQPDEGLSLNIISKLPGPTLRLAPIRVDFHSAVSSPDAYETLLRDVLVGDQTLFMRRDTVEAAWAFIQNILDVWSTSLVAPCRYSAGSWGPIEAAVMIAKDGRAWRQP